MDQTPDSDRPEPAPAPPSGPPGGRRSIRRRVIRLVLVPGAAAVVLWLIASGYLLFTGFYEREVANGVREASIPAVTGLGAIQRERRLSVAYVAHPGRDMGPLIEQRRVTDQLMEKLRATAEPILSRAPQEIATRYAVFAERLSGLPGARSTVDAGTARREQVYQTYNSLLDSAIALFDSQARVVPDVEATQGGIAGIEAYRASDLMARAGSIIAGAYGPGRLTEAEFLEFSHLVGAYHNDLANVAQYLEPRARGRFDQLVNGADWRELVAAEGTLLATGPWSKGPPTRLRLSEEGWDRLTARVSDDLIALTITQADEVSIKALDNGNRQLTIAALGSFSALLLALAAIWWAVRQSQILMNTALAVRLAQLGKDAAAVVDVRLPEMMAQLRRREKVTRDVDLLSQDYGKDEIGQLAEVLKRSLDAAVSAAVDEANARAASTEMLMGVARRPQRPLQHGLKVVEEMQDLIGDEKLLAELFDVNHQMRQTRRFLENLIILAGGQTGRRFAKPVPMRRVLLAAMAETKQYKRVSVRRAADVSVTGAATAGTIHLIAELLDNALAFSPPDSPVWVSCTRVERGIVVEIEDGGVGMVESDMARVNELLATAPTPDVTALKDGAQIGFWVVTELARREGIQVTLRPSAYGGVLAVVLLPERAVAAHLESSAQPLEVPTMDLGAGVADIAAAKAARALAPAPTPTAAPTTPAAPRVSTSVEVADKPAATGRPRLPQRKPQGHLNPNLLDEAPTDVAPPRSPDEARNRFARYQYGFRAGRQAGAVDSPPPGD